MAAFLIFTMAVCAAGFTALPPRPAVVFAAVFSVALAVTAFRTRVQGWQRTAILLRSVEVEIDDERLVYRSSLGNKFIDRAEITEACFSDRGIWLRGKSRRILELPPELENFDDLQAYLQEWLSPGVVRTSSLPSMWTTWRLYGAWICAALLLYVSLTSQPRIIAIPACILVGTGTAWYFSWCARRINERTWKVLLPAVGYVFAAVLLGRAIMLWAVR